mgnify:CR=1 FL=1
MTRVVVLLLIVTDQVHGPRVHGRDRVGRAHGMQTAVVGSLRQLSACRRQVLSNASYLQGIAEQYDGTRFLSGLSAPRSQRLAAIAFVSSAIPTLSPFACYRVLAGDVSGIGVDTCGQSTVYGFVEALHSAPVTVRQSQPGASLRAFYPPAGLCVVVIGGCARVCVDWYTCAYAVWCTLRLGSGGLAQLSADRLALLAACRVAGAAKPAARASPDVLLARQALLEPGATPNF